MPYEVNLEVAKVDASGNDLHDGVTDCLITFQTKSDAERFRKQVLRLLEQVNLKAV